MLGLPQSTEVKRPLPKAQLFKRFDWKSSQRDSFEDEALLAIYHAKLFTSPWQPIDSVTVALSGLNLDAVWQSLIPSIGQFAIEQESSLTEQIRVDDERDKLLRQIAALERQMNATKQPRRKRELFLELQKMKDTL